MRRFIFLLVAGFLLVAAGIDLASPGLAHNNRFRQRLTAVWGQGDGRADIEPFLDATTDFSARIRVKVDDAPPNTSFIVQRAPEVGRDAIKDQDGRCQRAFGFAPWSAAEPPAPSFVTFVAVNPDGTPSGAGSIILTTDNDGEGEVEFDFHAAAAAGLTSGENFDVIFRLIDDLANPGTLLLGGCVTVTVK